MDDLDRLAWAGICASYEEGEHSTVTWSDMHPDDQAYWRRIVSGILLELNR